MCSTGCSQNSGVWPFLSNWLVPHFLGEMIYDRYRCMVWAPPPAAMALEEVFGRPSRHTGEIFKLGKNANGCHTVTADDIDNNHEVILKLIDHYLDEDINAKSIAKGIEYYDEQNQYSVSNFVRQSARATYYELEADKGYLLLTLAKRLTKRSPVNSHLLHVARVKAKLQQKTASLLCESPCDKRSTKCKLLGHLPKEYPNLDLPIEDIETIDVMSSDDEVVAINPEVCAEHEQVDAMIEKLEPKIPAKKRHSLRTVRRGAGRKRRSVLKKHGRRLHKAKKNIKSLNANQPQVTQLMFPGTTIVHSAEEEARNIMHEMDWPTSAHRPIKVIGKKERGYDLFQFRTMDGTIIGQVQGHCFQYAFVMAQMCVIGADEKVIACVKKTVRSCEALW